MTLLLKNKHGFVHILLLLVMIGGICGLAAVFMYRMHSNSPAENNPGEHDNYGLSIEKHSKASPFINSYSLKFEWLKYKNASEGDMIAIPELKLISRSKNSIIISVESQTGKYSNPCALIEPWNCGKPTLPEDTIELPDGFIKLNEDRTIILRMNGKDFKYTMSSQNYYLSLNDSSERKLSTIPHYPDGTAAAHSTYAGDILKQTASFDRKAIDNAQHLCEQYTSEMITNRLRQYKVKIASDTYPGIEKIRPEDVLVLTNVSHVYNGLGDEEASLTPTDSNGCKLVLSGTYY